MLILILPVVSKSKKQTILSEKDFNLIVRVLKSNWWIPVVMVPLFYAMGAFYAYRITNVYRAATEFLIKNNETYYQNNLVTDANFYAYGGYVDNLNETRILRSYDLAQQVVRKLLDQIQVSYFIVGKVRITEQFKGMPFKVMVSSINPAFYERVFGFRIIDYDNYEITFEQNGQNVVKRGSFGKPLLDVDLPIQINRSESFSENTAASFTDIFYQFLIHSEDYLIGNLRSNLSVENPDYTQILHVELKDVLPERAVLLLDTLNSVYANSKLRSKFELNDRTIEYIDRQLSEISFALRSIEDTMQIYKNKRSIINLEWEEGDFLTKIGGYDNQRSLYQLQIEALNDLEKYIIEDKDPNFIPPNVFIIEKEGYMAKAVNELYSKQIELSKLSNIAKSDNPMVIDLKTSIRMLRQNLLVYINNTRKATQQSILNINNEILNYIGAAKQIPGKRRDILNIQRKANVSEQLYNFLLEKKASTKIARASIIPDVKIVESPRSIGTTTAEEGLKTKKQFIYLGLLLSLGIVATRALFFSKIETVEHLKDLTSIPVVGMLPHLKKLNSEGIIVEESPNSMMAEAFRNFRTNLQYSNVDINAKTFLITSFLPGEGKTFTSVNLATVLAKSGKRTALLELDLHKPRIFKRFKLPVQQTGITTYLSGQTPLEEVISETVVPNLFCIFSGPIPPNPSEFVLSEKMKELIKYAKDNFDYVIIDTPPAGLLSDSVYLMQNVDASIFVLNTKSSTRRVVTFIEDLIEDNNLTNISLILNGVKNMGSRYYYQGYGYSYGYGYGYGYGKGYGKGHSYRK